jgi:enoyl-CoA hydratase/carnithine racemase
MDNRHVSLEIRDGVATITLDRPEVHNAFDEQLIAELTANIGSASDDAAVRVIVLRGNGPSFCAGADLAWMKRMAAYSREENVEDAWNLQRLFAAIAKSPKVTIARVHGAAIGGGAGLAAACDIAIATAEAMFAFSEVRLGLVPAVIAPYVIRKIGIGAARALFVTAERFTAETALRIGLIQQIVTANELDSAVEATARRIRGTGPTAVATAKDLMDRIAGLSPVQAAGVTVECIADLRVTAEGQEGIRAFLEKRRPDF